MRTTLVSRQLLCAAGAYMLLFGCQHAAVRRGADTSTPVPSITPEELFEIGLLQARQGDLLRAEQYLIAARNRGFDEPTAVYWLVRVCVAAGRYHSALDHAARYARENPANWRLRLVVASIHEALGDLEAARLELEHVVDAQPTSPLPRYRLAMLYSRHTSETQRATRHFEAYLALDPSGAHAAEVEALLASSRRLASEPDGEPPAVVMRESEALP